jgi:hypothetical protein
MEKISRILPPSRRVTAVDTESSQPVRPGAPEFGRPSSKRMDVQDRVSLSSLARERSPDAAQEPATYKNPKESARAKAVEDLAEKFFNPKSIAKEGEGTRSEELLKSIEENKGFSPRLPPMASTAVDESDDSLASRPN